jgi:nifR3 family TIM-barrel protein
MAERREKRKRCAKGGSGPVTRMKIGSCIVESPFVLAPMAGYTTLPFRRLCRRFGSGLSYTELVNAIGLSRGDARTLRYLASDPAERPVAAHLYGRDVDAFAEAAGRVTALGGFDLIDINAGCPVSKVVTRGEGAGLLREPERLYAIVRAVRAATSLPVTVKTRIGPSPDRVVIFEVAQALAEAGVSALAVHARFTCHRHSGDADWNMLARLKASLPPELPLIGNGGARTAEQAVRMLRETGVDSVMIGRGAMGRPWIFREALELLRGETPRELGPEERLAILAEHLTGEVARLRSEMGGRRRSRYTPEQAAARMFRAHLVHYTAGWPGVSGMRRGLSRVDLPEDVLAAARTVFLPEPGAPPEPAGEPKP